MNGFGITTRGSNDRYVKRLTDINGNYVGTISYTKSKASLKKKKAKYNFKQISSRVLRAKTSGQAAQAAGNIKAKLGDLQKKLKSGEYDEEEIRRAILHAEMLNRACEKKKKHLEMEEDAERKVNLEEQMPAEDIGEKKAAKEEEQELSEEEFAALMEKLEADMDELLTKAKEQGEFETELDELSELYSGSMDSEDLDEIKKKHRAQEQRDVMKADLKYLKALFDRLNAEKNQLSKGGASGFCSAEASISIGGVQCEIPATMQSAPDVGQVINETV